MDATTLGNWMRDTADVELRDFMSRLAGRLSERELGAMKWAHKGIKRAQRQREETLRREQAAKRKREQHLALARSFDQAAQRALAS